ncbi:MAG: DNA (cytosine-5-)-methyltransferase [Lachnospiraceae bacterium]|nr:DNA (cytosine-5-)-methyltransferase [Ruminococcus sp.]MCM1276780.1 DNA (cytosine-5-)-methyltransferase [Lachnospiraceae bacterium]
MITAVSLFAGIGGIDIAFRQAGFEVIWANEIDRYACVTYRNNFTNPLSEADIKAVDERTVPQSDVLFGGFPCQSFSVMGYKRGFKDPRGNLFFEIARIAEHTKPKVILLENVKNLIYHDNGKTFITIHNTLAELGYYIKYSVQNASTHGNIPQERSRTFLAAFSDYEMMSGFSFPDEIPLTIGIEDILNRSSKQNDAFYYPPGNKYYEALNRKIPDKTGIYRIDDSGVATRKYVMSPTLKANMGTYPDRVPIIRDDFGIRKLTPYECLALQGFPADFRFKDIPLEAAYKQCGNTVCVPVVRRIAENLLKVF